MSLSGILTKNLYTIFCKTLSTNVIESTDASTPLQIGTDGITQEIDIGNVDTEVFINGVEYQPGTLYGATGPQAASDQNGILISNGSSKIGLEYADATHNGIVSIVAQSFGGTKTLTNGFIVLPTVTAGVQNVVRHLCHQNVGTVNFTGAGAIALPIIVEATDSFGTIVFGTSNTVTGTTGVLTSTTALSAEFRPGEVRSGIISVINNGAFQIGIYQIGADGIIKIGKGMAANSVLVAFDAGTLQILDSSSPYSFA